ncbi:MAG: DUF896 domain-containing protein [Clostridiaceae bacterium]
MEFNKVIERINYLYNKSKNENLTEEEKEEQKELKKQYIKVMRGNVEDQLKHYKKI